MLYKDFLKLQPSRGAFTINLAKALGGNGKEIDAPLWCALSSPPLFAFPGPFWRTWEEPEDRWSLHYMDPFDRLWHDAAPSATEQSLTNRKNKEHLH